MSWDTTKPDGTERRRLGPTRLRELKTDLQTAFQAYGHFPISSAAPKFHYKGQTGTTADRPAAGTSGFYFDTDRQALQRSDGTNWNDVATNFPAGTKTWFYQATAPTGWTIAPGLADRLLLINSGGGGTTGGSWGGSINPTTNRHSHSVGTFLDSTYKEIILTAPGVIFEIGYVNSVYPTGAGDQCAEGSETISGSGATLVSDEPSSGFSNHTHTFSHLLTNHKIAQGIVCQKT